MSDRGWLSACRDGSATALTLLGGGVLLVGVAVTLTGIAMTLVASFFWLVPALASNPAPIWFSATLGVPITIGGAVIAFVGAVPLFMRARSESEDHH